MKDLITGLALGPLTVIPVVCGSAGAAQSDWLYGVRSEPSGGSFKLERMDPGSGSVVSTSAFSGAGTSPYGLAYAGERLFTINLFPFPTRLSKHHPADAGRQAIGSLGLSYQWIGLGLDLDPSSGVMYFSTKWQFYRINPTNGSLASVGPYIGFVAPWDQIESIAIDSNGQAVAIGMDDGSTRHAFYDLDLGTGQLTWIADILIANGHGWYWDLAFNTSGELWASFMDNGLNPSAQGLYKIDRSSFAVTLVRPTPSYYYGIAFVPATAQATYCVGKLNSLGCVPEIVGDGFPSPTAASGYTIRATEVRNRTTGTLAFSAGARANLPFGGGTLCLTSPLRRTGARDSGGSPAGVADCSGVWQLDFNTWMAHNATLPAGTTVRAQWLGRDPGLAAPNNWSISNALEFDLRP